jgi:hypothetical protein
MMPSVLFSNGRRSPRRAASARCEMLGLGGGGAASGISHSGQGWMPGSAITSRPAAGHQICTEATLLEQGFTAGQLGWLVYSGFAKLRRGGGYTRAKEFRVKITEAGQRVIAE